ncbi:5248_t:CDS:10 [Entrophospora sp. SA101]|nr:5248_t:CDS:10 [Entrophospora sp. SA101]
MSTTGSPWFTGSVMEAVNLATTKNVIFMVYIYDENEESQQMNNITENSNSAKTIKDKTVALRISRDSEEAIMFVGAVRDYIPGVVSEENLISRINTVASLNLSIPTSTSLPVSPPVAEKEHEINRRTQGKAMQDVYRQQNEAKTKKIADEFAKQKKDEEEAKRRIREQIALDKAEHIYVRLLNGDIVRKKFQSTQTLEDVKTWIEEDRTDGKAPYNLIQNFPHRQFSINDETKSLKELNLCPMVIVNNNRDNLEILIMKDIKSSERRNYGGNNVRTLSQNDDDIDKRWTYNGNSTNQE